MTVGKFYVRLVSPTPPHAPLTQILTIQIHEQARNVLAAVALSTAATS